MRQNVVSTESPPHLSPCQWKSFCSSHFSFKPSLECPITLRIRGAEASRLLNVIYGRPRRWPCAGRLDDVQVTPSLRRTCGGEPRVALREYSFPSPPRSTLPLPPRPDSARLGSVRGPSGHRHRAQAQASQ